MAPARNPWTPRVSLALHLLLCEGVVVRDVRVDAATAETARVELVHDLEQCWCSVVLTGSPEQGCVRLQGIAFQVCWPSLVVDISTMQCGFVVGV